MNTISKIKTGFAAATLAVAMATTASVTIATPAHAQKAAEKQITLSIGEVHQINLNSAVTDVVVADPRVADVEVTSNKRVYVLAKGPGMTDLVASDGSGRTVYRAKILVGGNLSSLEQMFAMAMPEADIQITRMNNVVLLTGTVAQPADAAEAEQLAATFLAAQAGGNVTGFNVVNRIKTATPLQINLQVRVAEVARTLSKEITGNLYGNSQGVDSAGQPYFFGINRGREIVGPPTATAPGGTVLFPEGLNTVAGIGRLFGVDIEAAFDLSERAGLTSTLANPNLTTVSGETAEFLAGGRFPIVTSSNNGVSVQYETYGVNLTYTPIVLSDGRISLRVRTEVSDISEQGAVRTGGLSIPATVTRMAETTVEMGSGQSMMIAGLLSNQLGSSVDKTPGIGDVPVLGALFKSNGWRRNETELMIVITPYLVKPVSDSEIKLPTDGINSIDDAQRIVFGKVTDKKAEMSRPMPTIAPPAANGPELGSVSDAAPAIKKGDKVAAQASASGPGFSFDN
jgi:pilus assembly protein CpaC